jgi:hypothetical protein
MKMRIPRSLATAALLLALLLLSACEPGAASVGVPAGPESTPATAGASATTAGGESTTGAASRSLAQAIERTRVATTYRIGFDFELGSDANGQTHSQPFIVFDGDIKGDASHLSYNGGAFTEMIGGGSRVEMTSVDNRTYLKGSTMFGSAEPDRWYYLPDSGITRPPFNVSDILELTGGDVSKARAIGSVTVDGQACLTWQADFRNNASGLVDLTTTAENKNEFNQIDLAEARFNECADGFVHDMQWNVVSHGPASPAEKASISIMVHLRDFNAADIVVTAPQNAVELR